MDQDTNGKFRLAGTRIATIAVAFVGALAAIQPANAETKWNMHFPWPDSNYNVRQGRVFAAEVEKATGGEVKISVHSGGALGIKGPETIASVREGIVPIAGMSITQNAGDEPFFLLYSIPYLVTSPEEYALMSKAVQPELDEILAKHNQKGLYYVPWPAQIVYSKKPLESLEDLEGFMLRTADKGGTTFFKAIGASPVQLPWGEVVPALATGAIQGVTTSSTSGLDGKFWEFLDYVDLIKWNQSPEAITVNLDAWNALKPEHREAIERVATELQPKFEEEAHLEDAKNLSDMESRGMKLIEPSAEFSEKLTALAIPFWDDYVERVGGVDSPGGRVMIKYRELAGK